MLYTTTDAVGCGPSAARLGVADLMAPAAYAAYRQAHRHRLIAHRRERTVPLGPRMRLQFEDKATLLYQIHEVLRAGRIEDGAAVQGEIDAYAHLLPDGRQWKATLLIECPDAAERAHELPLLSRAAHHIYLEHAGLPRIVAQANEDLPDRHLSRPSSVHFLRFPLSPSFHDALRSAARVTLGCADPHYEFRHVLPAASVERLAADLIPTT